MRPFPVPYKNKFYLLLTLIIAMPKLALALTADQVYERVKNSVVVVKAYDRAGKAVGLGSGVVLPSVNIVTNYHVIESAEQVEVAFPGGFKARGEVIGTDPDSDLAVLELENVPDGLTPLPLGNSDH